MTIFSTLFQMDDPSEIKDNHICVLAVLAVIGGVDNRPRLGGQIIHEEWSTGTISKITNSGKVLLQCDDVEEPKSCKLTDLSVVNTVIIYNNTYNDYCTSIGLSFFWILFFLGATCNI